MIQTEVNNVRTLLEKKHNELSAQLRKREGIAIEKNPDAFDEVHIATERELATRNLERESKVLREVRDALLRVEQGSYGICLNCEEEIGPKRLKAVPWTPLCIACQEEDDRTRGNHVYQSDWLSLKAA
jgi:DnaK suppressor protein